jgi:hypothetical protein
LAGLDLDKSQVVAETEKLMTIYDLDGIVVLGHQNDAQSFQILKQFEHISVLTKFDQGIILIHSWAVSSLLIVYEYYCSKVHLLQRDFSERRIIS